MLTRKEFAWLEENLTAELDRSSADENTINFALSLAEELVEADRVQIAQLEHA